VAVDRAEVGEAQILEEHPPWNDAFDRVLELLEPLLSLVAHQGIERTLFDPLCSQRSYAGAIRSLSR